MGSAASWECSPTGGVRHVPRLARRSARLGRFVLRYGVQQSWTINAFKVKVEHFQCTTLTLKAFLLQFLYMYRKFKPLLNVWKYAFFSKICIEKCIKFSYTYIENTISNALNSIEFHYHLWKQEQKFFIINSRSNILRFRFRFYFN